MWSVQRTYVSICREFVQLHVCVTTPSKETPRKAHVVVCFSRKGNCVQKRYWDIRLWQVTLQLLFWNIGSYSFKWKLGVLIATTQHVCTIYVYLLKASMYPEDCRINHFNNINKKNIMVLLFPVLSRRLIHIHNYSDPTTNVAPLSSSKYHSTFWNDYISNEKTFLQSISSFPLW